MLFLLLFLFFFFRFYFYFLFFLFRFLYFFVIDVVQHNGVMLLGCFMIFFSSSFFFPFFFLLFYLNAETLCCFSCLNVSPTFFCTKRFSLYQVSVSGIIPSSLYLGLGPAGSRKKPCNRSWRSYSLKKKNKKNNNNIITGKIFQISLSNSGANRIGLHQLWAKWRSF